METHLVSPVNKKMQIIKIITCHYIVSNLVRIKTPQYQVLQRVGKFSFPVLRNKNMHNHFGNGK
jgi:hypothetical protein